MTAQITDKFIYNEEEYQLVGLNGGPLFTPDEFGMMPTMIHTACYRGFYCTYEITEKSIYLRQLVIRTMNDKYCAIDSVIPEDDGSRALYTELNLKIPFTGTMRLAKDFIQELYVHMGFQKPSAFKTVLDFEFNEGLVVQFVDRSKEFEDMRGSFKKDYEKDTSIDSILDAFRSDMGFK